MSPDELIGLVFVCKFEQVESSVERWITCEGSCVKSTRSKSTS